MSRPRTFLRCEINDAIKAAAENNMEVRFMPNGEMRLTPFANSNSQTATLDSQSEADKALAEWEAKHGSQS